MLQNKDLFVELWKLILKKVILEIIYAYLN